MFTSFDLINFEESPLTPAFTVTQMTLVLLSIALNILFKNPLMFQMHCNIQQLIVCYWCLSTCMLLPS